MATKVLHCGIVYLCRDITQMLLLFNSLMWELVQAHSNYRTHFQMRGSDCGVLTVEHMKDFKLLVEEIPGKCTTCKQCVLGFCFASPTEEP